MKYLQWYSLIQASTTLQRFKFFVTLIYLDIYYILYVLFQCKVRYIIIMYLFTNDKIFGDILPDAMQTFSSLDPRVLIKESGSGISWKEKKERNNQQSFINDKIYIFCNMLLNYSRSISSHTPFILYFALLYLWPRFRSRYTMWSVSIFVLQHGFRNWYERGKILWLYYPLYKNPCVKVCSDIKTHIYNKLSVKL